MEILLTAGADPNAQNDLEETPLMLAAAEGHKSATKLLLAHGADPDILNYENMTATDCTLDEEVDTMVREKRDDKENK